MSKTIATTNNLTTYFKQLENFPILSREEEYELANKLRDTGDIKAAEKLVMHNLKFVIKMAYSYSGYGLPIADLIQEGSVGLMKAVKRFSTDHNTRLVTYAAFWIKSEMNEYVMRNYKIVRMGSTQPQRKLFFSLRSMKSSMELSNRLWLTNDEIIDIANKKNVTPANVIDMETRLFSSDQSYEGTHIQTNKEDNIQHQPTHFLESNEVLPDDAVVSAEMDNLKTNFLKEAMDQLNDNHKNIIQHRYLNDKKTTLRELAEVRGVSCEAIRQAEVAALNNLRKATFTYQGGALL